MTRYIVLLENIMFCSQTGEICNQIFLKCSLINCQAYSMTSKGYRSHSTTWKTRPNYDIPTSKLSFTKNQNFLLLILTTRTIEIPFFHQKKEHYSIVHFTRLYLWPIQFLFLLQSLCFINLFIFHMLRGN